jgi:hypothetical protein
VGTTRRGFRSALELATGENLASREDLDSGETSPTRRRVDSHSALAVGAAREVGCPGLSSIVGVCPPTMTTRFAGLRSKLRVNRVYGAP